MHLQLANLYRGMGATNAHHCLGSCTTGADALALVARLKPKILLMVDDLPDSSLDNLSRQAKKIHPGVRSWAFISKLECLSAKTVIQILIADQDVLVDPNVLTLASMAAVTNTTYRSPAILRHLNSSEPYGLDESGQTFQLTPRERQLLEAYALGLSNQETARRLGLSVRTVQTYSSNLLRKLGVNNRQKALRRAISLGFNAVLRRFDHPE
jgi:DNA-binding NarL/FixJ family response regulator